MKCTCQISEVIFQDGTLIIKWCGKKQHWAFPGAHAGKITDFQFFKKDKTKGHVFTGSTDGTAKMWNYTLMDPVGTIAPKFVPEKSSIELGPPDQSQAMVVRVLPGGSIEQGTLQILVLYSGQVFVLSHALEVEFSWKSDGISSVDCSSDGKVIHVGQENGIAILSSELQLIGRLCTESPVTWLKAHPKVPNQVSAGTKEGSVHIFEFSLDQ